MDLREQITSILLQSLTYQEFLVAAFAKMKELQPNLSFARLAAKIGCQSKSYPRDVMIGRRTLSLKYAGRFAAAFGLEEDAKQLFVKMVEITHSHIKDDLRLEISNLKSKIEKQNEFTAQTKTLPVQKSYLIALERTTEPVKVSPSDDGLRLSSAMFIHSEDLPKLRAKLHELVSSFSQESSAGGGDNLVHLRVNFI